VGQILKGMEDKAIVIEGHTDSVPLRGELARVFPTNWELSAARATSIVRYLQDTVGVDPRRLSAVGFGPNRPLDTNDSPEGRARNRRIEIKLLPLDAPLLAPGQKEAPAAKP
jgi:chemotaxis protein MotB